MTRRSSDLTGQVFGRLKVTGVGERDNHRHKRWICLCECGNRILVLTHDLMREGTRGIRSCGCIRIDANESRTTHGCASYKKGRSPVYMTWIRMIQRCENPKNKDWHLYGGKGIKVCKEWRNSFSQFLADMGDRPSPKHSIDRISSDKDYEPSNCRWATSAEQSRNTSHNHWITYNGKTQCLTDWARELGFHTSVLSRRMKQGWSPEKALTTPVKVYCRSK